MAHSNQMMASSSTASANEIIPDADRVGLSGLGDTQWKTLVGLLSEREKSHGVKLSGMLFLSSWIIDTGASNHMTRSLEYL